MSERVIVDEGRVIVDEGPAIESTITHRNWSELSNCFSINMLFV